METSPARAGRNNPPAVGLEFPDAPCDRMFIPLIERDPVFWIVHTRMP
jgi:hypothetical protein